MCTSVTFITRLEDDPPRARTVSRGDVTYIAFDLGRDSVVVTIEADQLESARVAADAFNAIFDPAKVEEAA